MTRQVISSALQKDGWKREIVIKIKSPLFNKGFKKTFPDDPGGYIYRTYY